MHLAKNSSSQNNGEDWANSSTAFTTVTSSIREETEAVRYSDLEGWWKLDGNLNDSSGNNRHGTPPIIQTSSLWLGCGGYQLQTAYNWVLAMFRHGRIRAETDTMSAKVPGVAAHLPSNGLNGLQTLSFDGTHDHLVSTTVTSFKTHHSIYAVAQTRIAVG